MTAEAYPLAWPAGWKLTRYPRRSRFRVTFGAARDELVREIKRLRGSYIVLSTNVPLRRDGLPYASFREPEKPGVAVYFMRDGRQMVFACDKWDRVQDNIRAISKTIAAIRGMEAWGASEMMERTFKAFEELPAPKTCWDILNVKPGSSPEDITRAYHTAAMKAHPDHGGNGVEMMAINNARDECVRYSSMNRR